MKEKIKRATLSTSGVIGFLAIIVSFFPETITSISFKIRIIIFASGLLFIFLWFYFKLSLIEKIKFFYIKTKRIKIGIAINHELNNEIIGFCNKEIESMGLSSKIVFKSSITRNQLQKTFENRVVNHNADVIVWTPKEKRGGKISLKFTHKDRMDRLISHILQKELSSLVLEERMFNLNEETIDIDLNLEKNNIADFSLYIIGVLTSLLRGIDSGIYVFERLCKKVKNETLKKNANQKLLDLYSIKGQNLIYKGKYLEGVDVLKKACLINPNDKYVLSSLILGKFLLGEETESERISKKLLQNHSGFPIAHLDAAFFRVKNRNYGGALIQYKSYTRTKPNPSISLEAIAFLSKILDKDSTEIGYLFARGFLKRAMSEKLDLIGESTYEDDFKVFLDRASKNTERYRDFIQYLDKHRNTKDPHPSPSTNTN